MDDGLNALWIKLFLFSKKLGFFGGAGLRTQDQLILTQD